MALKPARLQWSDDGSLSSLDYDDIYFQRGKGLDESKYVFLEKNNLPERFRNLFAAAGDATQGPGLFCIAELGFGTGRNFLLATDCFMRNLQDLERGERPPRLVYASIEKHPIEKHDLKKVLDHFDIPLSAELLEQYPPLIEGFHHLHFNRGMVRLMLLFGDVADVLPQLSGKFDAWFLDGFSPAKNPEMWNEKLFPQIAARTAPGGTLATFSAASSVIQGLNAAGFSAGKTPGFGVKRRMTVAALPGNRAAARPKKIAVLGAGIAGCAAAHALERRGHSVRVFDRGSDLAKATSGNPVAVVYPKLTVGPSPLGSYHAHAFCYALQVIKNLRLNSWRGCGVKHLDMTAEDAERTLSLLARNEFPADFCKATEGGYLQPSSGMLRPVEFCRRLLGDIYALYGNNVTTLKPEGFDATIIALGPDSKAFPETEWLPLQSLRGQLTLLKPTLESQSLGEVICYEGYITPVVDETHCIGATFQREAPDPNDAPDRRPVRDEDDAENILKLQNTLPQLNLGKAQYAGSRAGYRATTPDNLPLIGPCPDYEAFRKNFDGLRTGKTVITDDAPYIDGLYITTGFGSHGMTGAPLAGEILACMISDEPLPVPQNLLQYLLPERFIFRGLKRNEI